MAADLQPAEAFISFIKQLGLREETGHTLWGGNIKSAQELAACSKDKLSAIVDDSLLLNYIHPVLTKFTFPITIAPDPYAKALSLMRGAAENGRTSCNQGRTQSDTTPFLEGNRSDGPRAETPMEVETVTQPRVIQENEIRGKQMSVSVSGGTFVQSSIMAQDAVTYNNQGTHMSINTGNGPTKTPETVDMSSFFFKNPSYNQKFTVDGWNINLQGVVNGQQTNDPSVYPLHNWGQSRALILNNTKFQGSMPTRDGADTDSKNLEALLKHLGFKVSSYTNKRKADILQVLNEFTASRDNSHAPMILVFIGSHGQREGNKDWFVGTDHQKISDEDVVKYFTPEASSIKKETPKLFFFQFCRQDSQGSNERHRVGTQSDSIVELEEPRSFGWLGSTTASDADGEGGPLNNDRVHHPAQKWANMLFAFATAPGTRAYRDTSDGSWFVSTFCKVVKENCHQEDLLSMLTMVNAAVMQKKGQENNQTVVQLSEFKSHLPTRRMLRILIRRLVTSCSRMECDVIALVEHLFLTLLSNRNDLTSIAP